MTLIFGNPWGFLGLLGIPLLVLIYYLRRRAKVVMVSTLFLLKRTQRESRAGRRFETFSNSLPFWLQVLAVLFLTWLLVEPKYGNRRVTQEIVVVLDSSASMQPVRARIREELKEALLAMKGSADHASYIVLDHDVKRPRIYQGDEVEELLQRLEDWDPKDGAVDPGPALRIARSLVGPGGVVVYVTDHEGGTLPVSSHRLALGEARANCGFTGVTVEEEGGEMVWTAMVRNYGESPQVREWVVETSDRQRSEPKSMTLPPRKLMTIRGRFPAGQRRCVVRLSGDEMSLDDVLPVVVKEPRVARLRVSGAKEVEDLGGRMVRGFPHLVAAEGGGQAGLLLRSEKSGEDVGTDRATIVFYEGVTGERPEGKWLSEGHELTKGLNFQGLSVRSLESLKRRADDEVLLWLGEAPVIVLRRDPVSRAEKLVFGFELGQSNAGKLPAVVVLLHRFCERVARETVMAHTGFFETGQLMGEIFPLAGERGEFELKEIAVDGTETVVPLKEGFRVTQRVAGEPGFLELKYGGAEFLEGAVVFADTREADLSGAGRTELPEMESGLIERRTREDRWWRVVGLLLLVLVLGAWYFLNPKETVK